MSPDTILQNGQSALESALNGRAPLIDPASIGSHPPRQTDQPVNQRGGSRVYSM
jgi:hypothetical protein